MPFLVASRRVFRHLAAGCALWGLLPAVHAAPDPPAPVRPDEKPQVLTAPLWRSGLNWLWLPVTVEHVKGSLIIDTGSPFTLLSDARYRFLLKGDAHKLPPGASATITFNTLRARVALAHDFSLGGHDLGASLVALVPERFLDEAEKFRYGDRASDFDGIMGENYLRRYRAVIDCRRQLLYLSLGPAREDKLPGVLLPNGWTRVPMDEVGGHCIVPCAVNGVAFRLVVDTGAPFTALDRTLLQGIKVYSHDLPLNAALIGNAPDRQGLVSLHTLQIGDYTATDVQMMASEHLASAVAPGREQKAGAPVIGLLGADTLGFNGAIIDLGGGALYLKHPPGGTKKPSL